MSNEISTWFNCVCVLRECYPCVFLDLSILQLYSAVCFNLLAPVQTLVCPSAGKVISTGMIKRPQWKTKYANNTMLVMYYVANMLIWEFDHRLSTRCTTLKPLLLSISFGWCHNATRMSMPSERVRIASMGNGSTNYVGKHFERRKWKYNKQNYQSMIYMYILIDLVYLHIYDNDNNHKSTRVLESTPAFVSTTLCRYAVCNGTEISLAYLLAQ